MSSVPGGYATMSGTSMAAPHVAGAVALLRQADPAMTADQVIETLRSTAHDLGPSGPDTSSARALVDVFSAVKTVLGAPPTTGLVKAPPSIVATNKVSFTLSGERATALPRARRRWHLERARGGHDPDRRAHVGPAHGPGAGRGRERLSPIRQASPASWSSTRRARRCACARFKARRQDRARRARRERRLEGHRRTRSAGRAASAARAPSARALPCIGDGARRDGGSRDHAHRLRAAAADLQTRRSG